jgi:pantothenate synthetase
VLMACDIQEIDYVEVRDADTLAPLPAQGRQEGQGEPILLIAARLGMTRLIDNRILSST